MKHQKIEGTFRLSELAHLLRVITVIRKPSRTKALAWHWRKIIIAVKITS